MKKANPDSKQTPSELISQQIAELGDWRGKLLSRIRKLILEVDPSISEEWKWNTAVWNSNGMVCAAGAFKDHVKINFFGGAALKDPNGLFNAGLDAKRTRAIDIGKDNDINTAALRDLLRAAIAHNASSKRRNQ
jgi:hypothetical protein